MIARCIAHALLVTFVGFAIGGTSGANVQDYLLDHIDPVHDLSTSMASDTADGSKHITHAFRETTMESPMDINIVKGLRASLSEPHDLVFNIRPRNMDELQRILYDVSDPASTNYGNHLSRENIIDLTSNVDSCKEVIAYLETAGASILSEDFAGGFITARGSVSLWESMLNTEFYSYSLQPGRDKYVTENRKVSTPFFMAERYSVPLTLDAHVAWVLNTIDAPSSAKKEILYMSKEILHVTPDIYPYISPQQLNNAYNITDNSGHPQAIQAILEGFGQVISPEDLTTFQNFMGLPNQPLDRFVGDLAFVRSAAYCYSVNFDICAESNLDAQYMMGMAATPTWHVYNDEPELSKWLFRWVNSPAPRPLVLSMSYNYLESAISAAEKNLFDQAAMMLGTMGVTILVASGDDGVSMPYARNDPSQCAYRAAFPNTSPYVISVGATQVQRRSSVVSFHCVTKH